MKPWSLFAAVLAIPVIVSCYSTKLSDPADAFAGTYSGVSTTEFVCEGQSSTSAGSANFSLTKISPNQVKIDIWEAIGTIKGNTINFEPFFRTDNGLTSEYLFQPGVMEDDVLTIRLLSIGMHSDSRGVPHRATRESELIVKRVAR